jgi:hypothetical protein
MTLSTCAPWASQERVRAYVNQVKLYEDADRLPALGVDASTDRV